MKLVLFLILGAASAMCAAGQPGFTPPVQSCSIASDYSTNKPVEHATLVPTDTFPAGWVSLCSGADPDAPCARHKVYLPGPQTEPRSPLVVFLPGSSMEPYRHDLVLKTAAYAGYRTIGLSYDSTNNVDLLCGTPSCPSDCSALTRDEIIEGNDTSTLINVSPADAIIWRLYALLDYLYQEDIADGLNDHGWDAYYLPVATGAAPAYSNIVWSEVIVSGFSQGAGHAARISKQVQVQGVVMIDGPGDSCIDGSGATIAADWLTDPVDLSAGRPHFGIMHFDWFAVWGIAPATPVQWAALDMGTFSIEDLDAAFTRLPPPDAAYTAQLPATTGVVGCPGTGIVQKHGSMADDRCMPKDATNAALAKSPQNAHLFVPYLQRFCHACDAATCP